MDAAGFVCADVLQAEWSSVCSVAILILSIQSILDDPSCEHPANVEAAALLIKCSARVAWLGPPWRERCGVRSGGGDPFSWVHDRPVAMLLATTTPRSRAWVLDLGVVVRNATGWALCMPICQCTSGYLTNMWHYYSLK